MDELTRYPCPCCGYIMFSEPPGSYEICPVCHWEDDLSQLRFASEGGGANHPSLIEAQQNFASFGANEERARSYVRLPLFNEARDPEWRPVDPAIDNIEEYITGTSHSGTYPEDSTALYYWRATYWRNNRATTKE